MRAQSEHTQILLTVGGALGGLCVCVCMCVCVCVCVCVHVIVRTRFFSVLQVL